MTDAISDKHQISLFSRETLILSEGYRCLSAFRFEEAKRFFNDVLTSDSDPESGDRKAAKRALKLGKYWHPLVLQKKTEPSLFQESNSLYREFREYNFANFPGEQQFRQALLLMITDQMLEMGRFYTGVGSVTVSDLLMELGRHKKAEEVVHQQMEVQPDDHQLYFILGQIQWQNRKKGEAKKNYTRGLLHNPCGSPSERIVFRELKKLIESEGPEMAPAFGWVRGVLLLIPPPDVVNFCSTDHRHALGCYRLLWQADRAVRNRNSEACVEYRKKLKAEAPALYDEYYALLQGGR